MRGKILPDRLETDREVKFVTSETGFEAITFSQQGPVHVAAVKLEQVHPPVSKGLSVGVVVAQAAGVSCTCVLAHVCVDAELQASGVDLAGTGVFSEAPLGGGVAQPKNPPPLLMADVSWCQRRGEDGGAYPPCFKYIF